MALLKRNGRTYSGLAALVLSIGYFASPEESVIRQPATWQRMASPGDLSSAHSHLEGDCAACHTAVSGAVPVNCILCHATAEDVLQRQPTAFHSSISSCNECHSEHLGIGRRPTKMDHEALARIGLRELSSAGSEEQSALYSFLTTRATGEQWGSHSAHLTSLEASLSCSTCHSKQDQHFGLFGLDCGQCHSTSMWTLPAFTHPSANSRDCAQCHQAPPSHYMMHFKMVSAKVAQQPHATVEQCFKCHRTTAWTDIPGIGHYKHH